MLSFLVFGSLISEGIKDLKAMKIKGRMSDKTKMAFICLEHIKYEKKYSLQEKSIEFIVAITIVLIIKYLRSNLSTTPFFII